ncbi:hypothetical protein DIPPA_23559 [Diplonema papillatum]|nr:hypothetical protein DIPPA_23559 [Diplonema papillatum]
MTKTRSRAVEEVHLLAQTLLDGWGSRKRAKTTPDELFEQSVGEMGTKVIRNEHEQRLENAYSECRTLRREVSALRTELESARSHSSSAESEQGLSSVSSTGDCTMPLSHASGPPAGPGPVSSSRLALYRESKLQAKLQQTQDELLQARRDAKLARAALEKVAADRRALASAHEATASALLAAERENDALKSALLEAAPAPVSDKPERALSPSPVAESVRLQSELDAARQSLGSLRAENEGARASFQEKLAAALAAVAGRDAEIARLKSDASAAAAGPGASGAAASPAEEERVYMCSACGDSLDGAAAALARAEQEIDDLMSQNLVLVEQLEHHLGSSASPVVARRSSSV